MYGSMVYIQFPTAENRRGKNEERKKEELKCGPMSNAMAALSNIAGALCKSCVIPFLVPRRKVWLTPADGVPCSNAANVGERKTWT